MENTQLAERNRSRFIAFRLLFNTRFYYPVLGVLFLDLGLSATEYTLLNFVWALVIVCAEVPSGVLADRIGRKPLLVAATVCMVLEMAVLLVAPRNGGWVLGGCCLLNRVLSGTAEAMASGADESLAYDSLAAAGRGKEWPDVLAAIMRWQSLLMPVAMLVGATVYDASLLNRGAAALNLSMLVRPELAARLPIVLTLLMAIGALAVSLQLREPERSAEPNAPPKGAAVSALESMRIAWRWIVQTPMALFAILGGVLLDSVVRLFMTFASVFYRLIELPVASFGAIGAGLGLLGVVVSPLSRWLVRTGSLLRNFAILALVILFGLLGVALKLPIWGLLFTVPLWAAMMALGFMLSNTLNTQVASEQRATVLSFRGLVFNLGYGFVSLLFALALKVVRGQGTAEDAFRESLKLLPLWLAFTLVLLAIGFWRHRKLLDTPPLAAADL
jgi:MFS family permease